jgi:GNAT superfamily N-acetyltransferase
MTGEYRVEPLSKKHYRQNFDCGEASLNDFLKRFARQNNEKGISRTYVAVKGEDPKIYGYYALSGSSVKFDLVPDNLPRYPVPFIHLGRLAVDTSAKGEGLGKALLFHAFKRSADIAGQLGIYAVEVFALNEKARQFYLQFGLTELKDDKFHLYITIKDILKLTMDRSG